MVKLKQYLIVDGYNIINAWNDLKNEMQISLESARVKLLDIMANYQAYAGIKVIVVFDAHYVKNSMEKHEEYNGLTVVFTKENETADSFIEKKISALSDDCIVKVATSDFTEQLVVLGFGAIRVSARELKEEINSMNKNMKKHYEKIPQSNKNALENYLDEKTRNTLEKWRRKTNQT